MEIIDTVAAYALEIGDLTLIDGDYVTITSTEDTEDNDEVLVKGTSHSTGDMVEYGLYAFEQYDLYGA